MKIYTDGFSKKGLKTALLDESLAKIQFIAEVPTVQGCHLLCSPFNLMTFSQEFPDVMVHKNSMGTLLYMPDLNNNKKERNE